MSANRETLIERTARLGNEAVRPLPGSRKVFVDGERLDVRVGMREVVQTDTPLVFGAAKNPPIAIYDTSGPYTDPNAHIDLCQGLLPLRDAWIQARDDVERLDGLSSEYGRAREKDERLDPVRFQRTRDPLCARDGACVTQMSYARRGVVTPVVAHGVFATR